MKMGVHEFTLAASLQDADRIFLYQQEDLDWSLNAVQQQLGTKASIHHSIDDIVSIICKEAEAGDEVLIMSNGGFGGIHQRLLIALEQ